MTQPDVLKKCRNLLAGIFVIAGAASFGAAASMNFWQAPLDYWLAWAAFATGFATIISGVASVILHTVYLEEMRSN